VTTSALTINIKYKMFNFHLTQLW